MSEVIEALVDREYAFGFHSDIETEVAPKGLSEDVVRLISATKSARMRKVRRMATEASSQWSQRSRVTSAG